MVKQIKLMCKHCYSLLDSMKMPGQRPGFQISDILGLNEAKAMETPQTGISPLELPPYAPPHHNYPHEFLRHHQPWLSLDQHENAGKIKIIQF